MIGQQFGHGENRNEAAQLLSHAVLGAVLAQVNGGSATAGAVSAAGAEAASNYIAKELYPYAITPNGDIDASLLTPEQRQNLSSLGAAVGAIGGGLVGNSLYNAAVGSQVGENAVVNNQVSNIPNPNGIVPGGPWTESSGRRPGNFNGPPQVRGPRSQLQWVPSESEGGR